VRVAVKLAALLVTADVERKHHFGGKFAAFLEHGIDGVGIHIGMFGHGLECAAHIKQLVQHELHVTQGRVVDGHGGPREWVSDGKG